MEWVESESYEINTFHKMVVSCKGGGQLVSGPRWMWARALQDEPLSLPVTLASDV